MTTIDDARTSLASARELFGAGRWDDLHAALHDVYEAGVLEGAEQGEAAFYLGEACLGRNQAEAAIPYLEAAAQLGDADFAPWAEEELARARRGGSADGHDAAQSTGAGGVDVSSYPELRQGSTEAAWVAHAQAKLAHLQHYGGRVDGWFGPVTDAAVKAFQASWGLPADGIIGQTTWSALETSAPGVTGTPDQHPHAHQSGQHGGGDGHLGGSGPTTVPEVTVTGEPAPQQHWSPETPSMTPTAEGSTDPEKTPVSLADEVEFSTKIPIDQSWGPITIKELPIKISGKISTSKGEYVSITGSGGTKKVVKIDWLSTKLLDGKNWDISVKGGTDFGESNALSGTLEITNGSITFEVKFTIVKYEKGKLSFAELTVSGGGKVEYEPIEVDGETMYLNGKLTIGITATPNWKYFAEKGVEVVAEESIPTGVAATGGAELVLTAGFVAGAVAVLYVGYHNMQDIEALKQLRTDSDKAVDDFAAGFVSAWTGGTAPGGYWGDTGANAGRKQFEADVHAYEAHMKEKYPGQALDAETLDEVKKLWRETAAEKAGAFQSVAEAMFGKMVRTAIYHAWLKANSEGNSLPGDITQTAKYYAGIPDGGSEHPDTQAGMAAAQNANVQVDIDRWQHALDQ